MRCHFQISWQYFVLLLDEAGSPAALVRGGYDEFPVPLGKEIKQ